MGETDTKLSVLVVIQHDGWCPNTTGLKVMSDDVINYCQRLRTVSRENFFPLEPVLIRYYSFTLNFMPNPFDLHFGVIFFGQRVKGVIYTMIIYVNQLLS